MARYLSKADAEARSAFRQQLRAFEQAGEEVARRNGITLTQYLILLHVKGMPERSWATVGELAERMLLQHHSVVGLVSRCEAALLVRRRRSDVDARQVQIHLTPKGERILASIAISQGDSLPRLLAYLKAALRQSAKT